MTNVPFSLQEPDRTGAPARSVWFGMRCDFTRAAIEGAMSPDDAIAPLTLVLPPSPRPKASGWPEPPFDRWLHSLGVEIIELFCAPNLDWQPVLRRVRALEATVGIGACFPYRVPRPVRDAFPLGVINIHPSLLPSLRGPEPVFHAYRLGLDTTGVSLHLMDDGWDTGPVLGQRVLPIPEDGNARDFETSLARHGRAMLAETVAAWQSGALTPQPQDHTRASRAPILRDSDLVIPTNLTVRQAVRMMRALGDTFGQLVVLDTATGASIPVALLTVERGDPAHRHDVVELPCADGILRLCRLGVKGGDA